MPRLLRSTTIRLGLFYGGGGALVLAALALVLWFALQQRLAAQLAAVVRSDEQGFADLIRDNGRDAVAKDILERVGKELDEDEVILLAGSDLTVVAGNLPAWPLGVGHQPGWYDVDILRGGKPGEARVLHSSLPDGSNLLVGRDLEYIRSIEMQLIAAFTGAGVVVVFMGILGAMILRRVFLRRIASIGRTAANIIDDNLATRLPENGSEDEFDLLAATINRMLDQIERLLHGVRNVSNAIAHDLRTPLTVHRAHLERLLMTRPDPNATFAAIEEALDEVDQLMSVFNGLLRLAELDSGVRRSQFKPVDLADLAEQVADLYGAAAEEKGITFNLVPPPAGLVVAADPVLLAQAVGNLVENALKFVPAGGAIAISLPSLPNGQASIVVADSGPGIPDSEKQKVLERFYRGSSGHDKPGCGLGLSLVGAIARLHGGSLRLEDNEPGLRAVLELPRSYGTTIARPNEPSRGIQG
jgi:signal transduction histidine kinase